MTTVHPSTIAQPGPELQGPRSGAGLPGLGSGFTYGGKGKLNSVPVALWKSGWHGYRSPGSFSHQSRRLHAEVVSTSQVRFGQLHFLKQA